MKKQDATTTIKNAIKSKKARAELKQNKDLKVISNAAVEDMQNQINKKNKNNILMQEQKFKRLYEVIKQENN